MSTIGDFFRKYDAVRVDKIPPSEQEAFVRATWAKRDERRQMADQPAVQFDGYTFGADPQSEFEPGGLLEGFEPGDDYNTDAAVAEAAGISLSDEELVGYLKDGRRAVVGMTVEGHRFWIEHAS